MGQWHLEDLTHLHHGVKVVLAFKEDFHSLFHIVAAVFDRFFNFCGCQFPLDPEVNIRFADVISHHSFKSLQTDWGIGHDIIVVDRNLVEQVGKLPSFFLFDNDPVIDFLGVEVQQDGLQYVLVIIP